MYKRTTRVLKHVKGDGKSLSEAHANSFRKRRSLNATAFVAGALRVRLIYLFFLSHEPRALDK